MNGEMCCVRVSVCVFVLISCLPCIEVELPLECPSISSNARANRGEKNEKQIRKRIVNIESVQD